MVKLIPVLILQSPYEVLDLTLRSFLRGLARPVNTEKESILHLSSNPLRCAGSLSSNFRDLSRSFDRTICPSNPIFISIHTFLFYH